jgi:signal transduction histidine kinase
LSVIEAESSLALQKERPSGDYRQSLETISQEAKQMSSLIDQLLALARADAGKEHGTHGSQPYKLMTNLSADVRFSVRKRDSAFN